MNQDHAAPESSSAGPHEINVRNGGGPVHSPLTVDSTAHSKWKSPVLPEKTRANRLACRLCKSLTTVRCIQCDHSFSEDGSGAGDALRFCWTKHKDQKTLWIIVCNLPIHIARCSEKQRSASFKSSIILLKKHLLENEAQRKSMCIGKLAIHVKAVVHGRL
jgi:hypothetical protein